MIHLHLTGNPADIGGKHGEVLRTNIERAIDVYRPFFARAENEILSAAKHFRTVISEFSADFAIEINAIAEGANVDPLWIYALNARSELMSDMARSQIGECTALYFNQTSILGQNWDWAQAQEELIALATIERNDGHKIFMMIEPGIIGKIGLNNQGLGLGFNFLFTDKPTNGLPLHVVNRAVLECSNITDARALLEKTAAGKSGNILIGNDLGQGFDMEFNGDQFIEAPVSENHFAHTNHFIDQHFIGPDPMHANSVIRLNKAIELADDLQSWQVSDMKRLLADRSSAPDPILREYEEHEVYGKLGTVCTIIMDLKARQMHFRKGCKDTATYETYQV